MFRVLLFTMVVMAMVYSKSTIDDIPRLFKNTIEKWDVQIRDKRDYIERYNRLIAMKRDVDRTTEGVMLDYLNRFAVNNDEEHAALLARSARAATQLQLMTSDDQDARMVRRSSDDIPAEYQYWEKVLGLQEPVQDQLSCGSCWSFPTTIAMEALYKNLTGEVIDLSEQFFIDCGLNGEDGCGGGIANSGFKFVIDNNNYAMLESDSKYEGYYQGCKFSDEIKSGEKNALQSAWLLNYSRLSNDLTSMIEGLQTSPVAFTSLIGKAYMAYTDNTGKAQFEDTDCSTVAYSHVQLLVGYTETILRVRGSYGEDWGDHGYINYKRSLSSLGACNFYKNAYSIRMEIARDIEYAFCNDEQVGTWESCRESCLEMNTADKAGWDLAVIPTPIHNEQLYEMAEAKWPGVKNQKKFNYLWMGLYNPDKSESIEDWEWLGDNQPYTVRYTSIESDMPKKKYGLINKNDGYWTFLSSETFTARGFCSRINTCYDISYKITNGQVTYSTAGDLVVGTTAEISCSGGYTLVGEREVTCLDGMWDGDDSLPQCVTV